MGYGLGDRVALVMGGSRGIGLSIAVALTRAGCRVAIVSRSREHLKEATRILAADGDVLTVAADATVRSEVEDAVAKVSGALGSVEILVNNVGMIGRASLLEIDDHHWDELMSANLKSVLLSCQAVVPGMIDAGWGRIINASSFGASTPALWRSVYCAGKAAVTALTKAWAGELAPYGITVNAYAPGNIETDMLRDLPQAEVEEMTNRTAMQRLGTPAEVAALVLFLASNHGSYITGAIMDISGGKYVVQDPWRAWSQHPSRIREDGN
jgi:3-oxoacyl-[acyl-carrier protein] reductase